MATETKTETKKTQETSVTSTGRPNYTVSRGLLRGPVIVVKESKRRKKKRYTRGTKGVQKLTLGLSRGAFRATNSVAEAFRVFAKRSNRSARKRKDGLVRDSLRNASRGLRRGFRELGDAPVEVARQIGTRRVWRTFRVFVPFGG
jgi:hypothetical protein